MIARVRTKLRALQALKAKELHRWVPGWAVQRARASLRRLQVPLQVPLQIPRQPDGLRHLVFAVCDHYEPLHGNVSFEQGLERVVRWRRRYPELARRFADANGRPPRHSYFFPGEQYDPRFIEPLAEMCELGLGEVEVHLHHDGDTRETLRAALQQTLRDLGSHGVIAQYRGQPAWAFIHGNWCLANARADGRWCGVDDEMELLYELGCYADLTFPSAPDPCQPHIVNSIYYPRGDIRRRRAYEDGELAHVGMVRRDRLLMIQGPLAITRRPGKAKVRIEGGALDAKDPPTPARLHHWVRQNVTIAGRPDWVFVKVHTHGAPEGNAEAVLGENMAALHTALREHYNDGIRWQLHYATAREMYNVARAAMDGQTGSPSLYFDYEIPPPARARAAASATKLAHAP
ncbi:hypothetical protein [Pendulispora albinea]|uniref:Uncharacterized protein n=1 Tax=Pendulispora albinea TaxID=2741071 RepID=A0ABZ2M3Z6_9BACT